MDINTASAENIERACGIDGVLAQRIVAYRDEHGPFEKREDLDRVPGFAEIRTDEVLSVVDLPGRGGATKRGGSRSRSSSASKQDNSSRSTHTASGRSSGTRSRSTDGSKSSGNGSRSGSARGSQRTSRSGEPTTDHEFIRNWVEERGGWPACVKGTGRSKKDIGMIRIDFPGFSGSDSLERIEWDQWFQQFDENELAFLHRDMKHKDGELDRFNKLVRRQ